MALDREWMRGAAPLAVATLLKRREMYGYELCATLEEESGDLLEIGQSTVYTLLYSLEQRGYVSTTSRVASTGRKRKYYQLTASGRRWLDQQNGQWSALVEGLGRLGVKRRKLAKGDA